VTPFRLDVQGEAHVPLLGHADGSDRQAFEALFPRSAGRLTAFFLRAHGDRDLARDMLQQTFLHLHRSRADFRPGAALRSWLYTIEVDIFVNFDSAGLYRGHQLDVSTKVPMLGETLQQLGVEVIECHDGLAAWHLLDADQAPCDLLISDIHMPGMDGTELGAKVAARHPQLPILFISGHVDEPGDLPAGPIYQLLTKPFSRRRLVQYLGELLAVATD